MNGNHLTTSAQGASDPWPLLRKRGELSGATALRLVIHGRSGGLVPPCLQQIVVAVAERRAAPVELEVLTAEHPSPVQCGSQWLVPLLLLPGSHARSDVPLIRNRLKAEGVVVKSLPFLGAWDCWWVLMSRWIEDVAAKHPSLALVHHPLRPGISDRFLASIQRRFDLPVVPFDAWDQFANDHPNVVPLPLSLAPNRMSEALRQAGGLPSLLEDPQLRQGLIHCLALLP
ncbi:MAG: DNA mismatch repair protein MutS [Synechococcus sp. TMED66]|uniref:DNA mismatch repair protein MutS n=1 Tax=Synechococcus sp. PROS-9-1 TaxID=1968775 RepID=UPI000B728AF2|nr:DNA mismatch repair protein MutS [Synechococcus sp. PROS-9-1]MBC8168720.1 DNA mismatch repair protein MutS [Synechococcus sp.]MBL6888119.1 DNA mismatch repair protein MutS [Synechococcus sp. BS30m-G30]RCL60783.1 MAG: DNA mismatch repair protein MutS [Synechococcus sp. MED-G68]RPF75053.1 MAG: DNA mismatch repair protein MutS [Synechococcus sp. TMED66]QNJ33119.1 putative chelatase [Synechococcus sp. PROS-9-1]|tara:strand:+ start:2397 stop:3083 length:687 start_codon:yes stop_codon:yes gene_type:complete